MNLFKSVSRVNLDKIWEELVFSMETKLKALCTGMSIVFVLNVFFFCSMDSLKLLPIFQSKSGIIMGKFDKA